MLAATCAVVGFPVVAAVLLRASGTVTTPVPLAAAGMALSIAASYLGAAFWATRAGAGDTVFGDLMVWGWLRRWRTEWQLASAVRLLGLRGGSAVDRPSGLSLRQRAQLLERLAGALEAGDPGMHGHSRRVARHAVAMARRMGLPRGEVARIRTAAAVHDVGKIETPAEILGRPGRLSDEELAVIRRHAAVGARMVAGLGDEELTRIVRHHHERLDGKGYPDGLAGDRIPLGARIVAVADTFDAVTSTRPYRPARRHREALALLAAVSGTQLDPDAVRAFRGYYSGLRPVALWALLLNGPRQLLTSFGDRLRLGETAFAAKATAATVATLAAGGMALHALPADPGSRGARASGTEASRLAALRAGGEAIRSPQPSGGSSHSHGSHQQGGGGGRGGGTPESPPANPVGSGPEAQSGGGGSPGGGGSAGSGPAPSGGPPGVTLPDSSEATAPVGSAAATVVESVELPPLSSVTTPTVTDARSLAPGLPAVGVGPE